MQDLVKITEESTHSLQLGLPLFHEREAIDLFYGFLQVIGFPEPPERPEHVGPWYEEKGVNGTVFSFEASLVAVSNLGPARQGVVSCV